MTTQEQLQLLLKLSGLTQAELAARLGVTFAAFNRWVNGKAVPRPKARAAIDELYKEYSGEKQIPATALEAKKGLVFQKRKAHRNVLKGILDNPDIRDQFYLSLTYNSNRIEGSTLSENETAAVLFHNAALPDKSLVEQLEAKNHQAALAYLFQYMADKKPLDEALILKLHGILMNAVRPDAGNYRHHGVRIMGTFVPTLVEKLVEDINRKTDDRIAHIADVHSRFEKIHPFSDGNGRIGRLLMHAMALKTDLSPVVVLQEKKRFYVTYLNKAQMKDDFSLLEDFLCDGLLEGYRIVERELPAAQKKRSTLRPR
ncbi:MAG: Fic family protein [Elusimicrobia bacterium]|nr:Fic family protein [Elusimicrobiota bacterium]